NCSKRYAAARDRALSVRYACRVSRRADRRHRLQCTGWLQRAHCGQSDCHGPAAHRSEPGCVELLQQFSRAKRFVAPRQPQLRGPTPTTNNWYIARVDYKLTASGNHSLFWRGALRNDNHARSPYFLGQPSLGTTVDFSKGFTVGYTGTIRPNLLNNFRYGYTRQSIGLLGNNDTDPFIFFRGLNDNNTPANSSLAVTRSFKYQTPVHNIVDDISWIRGRHTFQFGKNIRFIRNPRENFLSSFSDSFTNSSGLDTAGLANQNSPLDPGANGFPAVAEEFNNSY